MKKKYARQYHAQIEQPFLPRLSSLYDDTKTRRSSMSPMNCDSACPLFQSADEMAPRDENPKRPAKVEDEQADLDRQ